MEEEIEHLKELKEELSYILDKTNLASETHLNYHRKVMAIEFVLNELERLQKDNYKLDRENQQLKLQNITYEVDNKEVLDALHMLLHCSLKDTEYVTQVGQFNIVSKYIKQLETENSKLKKQDENISRELIVRTDELNDSIPKQVILDLIEANLEKENGNYICDSNPCQTLVRHLIRIIIGG